MDRIRQNKKQINELNQKENIELDYIQESTNYPNVDNYSFYYFNKNSKISEFLKFSKLIKGCVLKYDWF